MIDQHAAHERILYDELSSRKTELTSQQLLIPREVTLTPTEMSTWDAHQREILDLGFGITKSCATSLLLSEVPILNGQMLGESYLHAVLSILDEFGKDVKETLLKEKLMQTACKHAVKGGEAIEQEEIRALLDLFMSGEVPLTCPHGRPVIVRITKTEIEKMFHRIV